MSRSPAVDAFAPSGTISVQLAAVFVDDADTIDTAKAGQAIGREPIQIIKVKPRSWINNFTDSVVHNSAFEWSIKDFSLQSHLNSKSINAACICSQVLGCHLITYPGKW